MSEPCTSTGLHLDECNGAVSFHHKVDVAAAGSEPALNDAPSSPPEPPLRNLLPQRSKRLSGR